MTTCRQIGAQTSIIMLAGYETTSVTLTYCIYLLSKHPQVQQKLLQEVDDLKGQPSYEQLGRFPYAAAVLNEALRLFPPAPLFARVAQEDAQVKLRSEAPESHFSYAQKALAQHICPMGETDLPTECGFLHEVVLMAAGHNVLGHCCSLATR